MTRIDANANTPAMALAPGVCRKIGTSSYVSAVEPNMSVTVMSETPLVGTTSVVRLEPRGYMVVDLSGTDVKNAIKVQTFMSQFQRPAQYTTFMLNITIVLKTVFLR